MLDEYELEHIFDSEFRALSGITSRARQKEIRRLQKQSGAQVFLTHRITFLQTQPSPRKRRIRLASFTLHAHKRTRACCPAKSFVQCVQEMSAGNLDVVGLLHMEHLIVDEFQDLNPMDLEFVDFIIRRGVNVFMAGDDDQSVYSFRFANPCRDSTDPQKYPAAGLHQLTECFRSMPNVLQAAATLIAAFPPQIGSERICTRCTCQSQPPPAGIVHLWRFATGRVEAKAIAESCRDLIAAGISPKQILILLSNRRALGPEITAHLQGVNVPICSGRDRRVSRCGCWKTSAIHSADNQQLMSHTARFSACVQE